MDVTQWKDRFDALTSIWDDCNNLEEVFDNASEDESIELLSDSIQLQRIGHILSNATDLLRAELEILVILENYINEIDDETGISIIHEGLIGFCKDVLCPKLKMLLDISKQWSFDDYRSRNFQSDLRKIMTEIYNYYRKEYGYEG